MFPQYDTLFYVNSDAQKARRKSERRSFVKEVRVTSSDVSLDYTPQLLEGMMSRETFLVPPIVHVGGPWGTVSELLFEKKGLIPMLQQLLISYHT